MRPLNFVRILSVCLVLSGYSALLQAVKPRPVRELPGEVHATGLRLVRPDEAEALWHEPGTLFIDVRTATDYEFGHITGAVHLPEPEFESRFPALKERLQQARVIVVYCKSVDCGLSLWMALRLHREGLRQTVIYPEGWNVWVNRGYPVTRLQQ